MRAFPALRSFSASICVVWIVAACGGQSSAVSRTPTPTQAVPKESPPTYNFAVGTLSNAAGVQGLRATIQWSVAPITLQNSAQSTWIGMFGEADPSTHLSLRVAQIGWKQQGPEQIRIFWEWGSDRSDNHISYGALVRPSDRVTVEVQQDGNGLFTFTANGAVVGQSSVPWQPRYLSVGSETHHPGDLMAGSASAPQVISAIEWEVNGQWQSPNLRISSTYPEYQITSTSDGTLKIWDLRQHS